MIKLVILFYGLGDLISTYLALNKGYTEQNPVGVWLLEHGFIYLILSKIFVIYLVWIWYNSKDWWIAQGISNKITNIVINTGTIMAIIIGIIVTINNSLLYMG